MESLTCVLVLHTKKLISGLVIPAIQFNFPSIPLSLVILVCNRFVFKFLQSPWVQVTGDMLSM